MKYRIKMSLVPGYDYSRHQRKTEPDRIYTPQRRSWWSPFWRPLKDAHGKTLTGTLVDANQYIVDDIIRRSPERYLAPDIDPQFKVFE